MLICIRRWAYLTLNVIISSISNVDKCNKIKIVSAKSIFRTEGQFNCPSIAILIAIYYKMTLSSWIIFFFKEKINWKLGQHFQFTFDEKILAKMKSPISNKPIVNYLDTQSLKYYRNNRLAKSKEFSFWRAIFKVAFEEKFHGLIRDTRHSLIKRAFVDSCNLKMSDPYSFDQDAAIFSHSAHNIIKHTKEQINTLPGPR